MKETKKRTLKNFVVSAFIVIAATFSVTSTTASAANHTTIGDVDNDGTVTAVDASLVLNYYANCAVGNEAYIDELRADVDNDGSVTAVDASYILNYYANTAVGNPIVWPPYSETTTTTTTNSESNTTTTTTTVVNNDTSEFHIGNTVNFCGTSWNVRSEPQFSENVISTLENGDLFDIIGIVKDNWYIISNDTFEYDFVQIESEVSHNFTVEVATKTELSPIFNIGDTVEFYGISWNMRSTPIISNNVITELENGDTFEIIGILADDWYLISSADVPYSYIRIVDSSSHNFTLVSSEPIVTTTTSTTTTTTSTTTTTTTSTSTTTTHGNCSCCTCTTTVTSTTSVSSEVSVGDMFAFTGNYWNLYDEEGSTNSVALLEYNQGIDIWEIGTLSNWYKVQVNNKSVYWIYISPQGFADYFPEFWNYWQNYDTTIIS